MLVGLIVQNESRMNAEIQSGIDKTIQEEYRGDELITKINLFHVRALDRSHDNYNSLLPFFFFFSSNACNPEGRRKIGRNIFIISR